MSDNSSSRDRLAGDSSRRSVLKKGALASLSVALGSSAIGTAAAQEEGADGEGFIGEGDNTGDSAWFQEDEAMTAVMYQDAWVPNGLFTVASQIIEFQPDAPGVSDNVWSSYNTRIIRYMGTNEHVLFFPTNNSALGPFDDQFGFVVDDDFVENDQVVVDGQPVGDQLDDSELQALRPTIFIYNRQSSFFDGDDEVIEVEFSPVPENEEERIWGQFEDDFSF